MKTRLRLDARYKSDIKKLLFDILFTDKKFSTLMREYRRIDGKSFFVNSDDLDLEIEKLRSNKYEITNDSLDDEFEKFISRLLRVQCDVIDKKK